jgi:hypothetical protein
MKYCNSLFLVVLLAVPGVFLTQTTKALAESGITSTDIDPVPVRAVICEQLKDRLPKNEAIVFSITNGRVYCYTDFDPVYKNTHIYHNWFRRDILTAKVKLSLKPPRWSTFSYISLRNTDKGPWRVEITGPEGYILQTLRFSITD